MTFIATLQDIFLSFKLSLLEVLAILFIHWFADFVLQTDKQAKGKSKNFGDLIEHTWSYTLVWFVIGIGIVLYNLQHPFFEYRPFSLTAFMFITFVSHTLTDYFTSRLNSKLWAAGKIHNFFVSIGFDQWLHYVQLFITYYILFKS